ncbi:MAG: CcmD family protein, partial [Bacteroidota bacterium]
AFAQDKANALEGTFFDSGKIWVVVAVAGIILLGIFAYLFKMDKALSKLEEEVKSK